jgi:hypothetical protein
MNPSIRPLALVLVLACLATAAGLASWTWLSFRDNPGDSWEEDFRSRAEHKRREALEARRAAFLRRLDAKQQVETALLDGRMTLAEAAIRFRAIYKQWAAVPYTESILAQFPGRSEDERYCRWVIACIRAQGPGRAASQAGHLERELEEQLRPESVNSLPDGP